MSTQALQIRGEGGAADVAVVTNRVALIQQVYKNIMQKDVHYGVIPGTPKPSLWKPGAEVILVALNAACTYPADRIFRALEKDFILYEITAAIKSNASQQIIAEGIGLCSSREEKYAWRKGSIVCPSCGKEAIIKGKAEYGGGWLCFKNKGGCGQKWKEENAFDPKQAEKVANPNIWEQANTVLKMAEKRALVAAVLNLGASDIFTQDIEDFVDVPNQAGWNGTGSKEAAQAVAQEKLRDLSKDVTCYEEPAIAGDLAHDPAPDIAEDPLEPEKPVAVQQSTPGPRPAANPKGGSYLYREQAADLVLFGKAKKAVGELAYRNALLSHGVERSLQFQSHAKAEECLKTLRECAAAQAADRKLQKQKAEAEANAASLLCHQEGSGCSIPLANQIAKCVTLLKWTYEQANVKLKAHRQAGEEWETILVRLTDMVEREAK